VVHGRQPKLRSHGRQHRRRTFATASRSARPSSQIHELDASCVAMSATARFPCTAVWLRANSTARPAPPLSTVVTLGMREASGLMLGRALLACMAAHAGMALAATIADEALTSRRSVLRSREGKQRSRRFPARRHHTCCDVLPSTVSACPMVSKRCHSSS